MKGFGIYVKNDLLEPKHFKAIGQALWVYLWLLDKMTSISEDGIGKVLGGSPIKFSRIQEDLPMSPASFTRYIEALETSGYITTLRTPYGHVFTITKAKKIFNKKEKENNKNRESQKVRITNVTTENNKCDENKEDNTVDNTNTLSQSEKGLGNKKKDMSWNKHADDFEEGSIDLDGDGTLKEIKKPATKKYPNAPVVIKLFQEILGINQTFWKKSPAILESCERLYTERGVEKIRNALEFYKERKEDKYCPQITSPKVLEEKYSALSLYKTKHGNN